LIHYYKEKMLNCSKTEYIEYSKELYRYQELRELVITELIKSSQLLKYSKSFLNNSNMNRII